MFLNQPAPKLSSPVSKNISKQVRKRLFPEAYPSVEEMAAKQKQEEEIAAGPEASPELPSETDPDLIEAQRRARLAARKRRGIASTILTGGQLGDSGYGGTVLG